MPNRELLLGLTLAFFVVNCAYLAGRLVLLERKFDKQTEDQVHAWTFVETSPPANTELRSFAHQQINNLLGQETVQFDVINPEDEEEV